MNKRIHILGICGTFMGGLAILARQLGYEVSGSDENIYPPMSDALAALNIKILNGYHAEHLEPAPDLVIVGNVCSRGNPAVEYMLKNNMTYYSGPEWLRKNVLHNRHVLAVSGTHGKTTTTSMLAWILQEAGLNPGYLIGGVANNFMYTSALGSQPYFVIEADEYDSAFFDKRPKFLHYHPNTLVIKNIEFDHADIYNSLDAIKQEFSKLVKLLPETAKVLYPEQDQNVAAVVSSLSANMKESFIGERSSWRVKLIDSAGSQFEVFYQDECCGVVNWELIGEYNIDNALSAIAAAHDIGVAPSVAVSALSSFAGVRRRLEVIAYAKGVTVYDDFAHHPTAILKTIQALRTKVGQKNIIAVVQFGSNTMRVGSHDFVQLANALNQADQVVLLDPKNANFQLSELCQKISTPLKIHANVDSIMEDFQSQLKTDDHVLIMSNKDFGGLRQRLVQYIS